MRRSIRTRGLPDGTHQDRIYEFVLREDLHLEIPGEHRGPEIVVAYHPEQERWVDGWRARGLTPAWDCLWAFRDRAALEAFEAELLAVEAASAPASAAPPATVSAASQATVSAASQATAPAAPTGPPQLPAPAWDVDESWGRIEAWLAREWSEVLADLRPGASARDLASLERGLELPLSPDLRRSLERHDGQHGRAPGDLLDASTGREETGGDLASAEWSAGVLRALVAVVQGPGYLWPEWPVEGSGRTSFVCEVLAAARGRIPEAELVSALRQELLPWMLGRGNPSARP